MPLLIVLAMLLAQAQAPPVKLPALSNFSATVIRVGRSPGPVSIGKLTREGDEDIVVGNYVRKAPGSPFPAGEQAWQFAVGDVNGDGNADVLVIPYERDLRDRGQFDVRILLGDGWGRLTPWSRPKLSLEGCAGPARVAIGDVNRDGYADIVVSCAQNNRLIEFLGSRGGTFSRAVIDVPTGWGGLAIGHLGSGGQASIVVANNNRDTITILTGK